MKRLTKRENNGSITIENATKIAEAFDRLAAYEDTGLEPHEVSGLCEMDKRSRMVQMLRWEQAEAEGRLVVLPCKVGSKVWLTGWWDVCTWVSKLPSPIERRLRYFSVESDGVYAYFKDGCINVKYFGKTAFLTREEAEEALRRKKDEN